MKRITMIAMGLATIIASSTSSLNSINKQVKSDPAPTKYQLQLVVYNNTWNIPSMALTKFYLDIEINGTTYNCNDFQKYNNDKDDLVTFLNTPTNHGGGNDVFIINSWAEVVLYSIDLNPKLCPAVWRFTFGTYYASLFGGVWMHSQLTFADNYQYNFIDEYNKTKNNGTQIYITAGGDTGSNNASWTLKYYSFK